MGPDGIPTWSTSSAVRVGPVPPPTNITVSVISDPVLDIENKVVEVIALVQWQLPVLDGGGNPANKIQRRRRQQSDEGGESQTGTRMGQGESGDGGDMRESEEVVSGELTNIFIYMGTTPLDRFAPRPEENVQEFKVIMANYVSNVYTYVCIIYMYVSVYNIHVCPLTT